MTSLYDCDKPAWSHKCLDPGLGLGHTILQEKDFTSPYEALERAVDLAFDLGITSIQGNWIETADASRAQDPCVLDVHHKPCRRSSTSVSFVDEIHVLFGPEDSMQMFEMQIQCDALSAWEGKPWGKFARPWIWASEAYEKIHRLPTLVWGRQEPLSEVAVLIRRKPTIEKFGTMQNRLSDAWHQPLPPEIPRGETQEEDPDVIPDPVLAPTFVHDLFEMADMHRAFTNLDGDGTMRVRSWYIHHADMRSNLHPRFLEFEEDWRRWEQDLALAWRDMIQPNQELCLHVVKPDPYRGYLQREIHADIILSQGHWLHRMAALTTVHRSVRATPPASFAIACSLPRQIGGVALAAAADVLQSCNAPDITCTCTHSWATIPFTMAPIFDVHAGDSFTITMMDAQSRTMASGTGAMGSGAARVEVPQRATRRDDGSDDHDYQVPPEPPERDDENEEDHLEDAESSLHSGDLSLLVYRHAASDFHCFAPGGTYMSILSGIIRAGRIPRRAVRCFHYAAVTPVGVHPDSEEVVILQVVHDIQPGSDERLVLVDVEVHFHPLPGGLLVPTATSRRVVKLQPQVHRGQLLLMTGLMEYCQVEGDTCMVFENHAIWHAQDRRVHQMVHGTYIRIQVPPPRDTSLDTEIAIGIARDFMEIEEGDPGGCPRAMAMFQLQSELHRASPTNHLKNDVTQDQGVPWHGEASRPPPLRRVYPDRSIFPSDQQRSLETALRMADLIECEEEGRVMYITTWYLHPERQSCCFEGRSVRLTEDDSFWLDDLIAPWSDVLDPHEQFMLRVVQPTPPCSVFECVQAHVIIEQGLQQPSITLLASMQDQEYGPQRWTHRAYVTDPLQNMISLLRLLELRVRCAAMRCSATIRDIPLALNDMDMLPPATNVVVRLSRVTIPTWIQPETEEMDLMQRSSASSAPFRFNIEAREFIPEAVRLLRQQPEVVQDLHALWDPVACAWEDEPRAGRILSWFVDQERGPEVCNEPRTVVLCDDVTRWLDDIRKAWLDHLTMGAEIEYHLVSPQPPQLEPNIIAHVIIVQNPSVQRVTPLVTIFDRRHNPNPNRFTRMAVTLGEHVEVAHIVAACGYSPWRSVPQLAFSCQVWIAAEPLLPGRRHPGRDGDSFSLYVTPDGEDAGNDEVPFLQVRQVGHKREREERLTTDVVAHAQWPSRKQKVAFRPVILAFERLDVHLFLPRFDLLEIVSPHPAEPWIQDWWDFQTPGTHLRVYFDGSFVKSPDETHCQAGTAIAAFLYTEAGWVFAGALSSALPHQSSSYLAELAGAIAAHKFVFDILKLHFAATGRVPEVMMCYDALTIGRQAAGDWSCISHPTFGKCLRGLALLVEQKFRISLQYRHIKGHTGEPGNELVDVLANTARQHGGLIPFADWLETVTQAEYATQLCWAWLLFEVAFVDHWHEGDLYLPGPSTIPAAEILPTGHQEECVDNLDIATIHLRLASCNVLTLRGSRDTGTSMAGVARQQALFQQLKEENITIFALQETRLRKLHNMQNDDFFLLKAAANEEGQGGIIIGFSKKQPYGLVSTAQSTRRTPAFFHDDHFKIIAFDPRFLIVRIATPYLRCVVVAAHAPHSGQDLLLLEQWWRRLHEMIPETFQQWPIILLCDANAVVGAQTSKHIGDHHAGKEDAKAEPFTAYVAQNDLWLPATFEACQVGQGATWDAHIRQH